MVKKYVLKKKDFNLYNDNYLVIEKNRTPVLIVDNDTLIFENKSYNLGGLKLEEWLENNKEELKHNISINGKNGTEEVHTYSENMVLEEVKLADDEDFYVTYIKSEQDYKKDVQQLNNILKELQNIFHFIEPDIQNEQTYGLAIRDLIIKTCTEVETHWKEIIYLNGYRKSNLTTKDYIKLKEFINFEHEIFLTDYPLYPKIEPFKLWNSENPTKSIEWYQIYNELKHDRTNMLSKATFKILILSVSALYILMLIRYDFDSNLSNQGIISIFKSSKRSRKSKWKMNSISVLNFIKINRIKYFE